MVNKTSNYVNNDIFETKKIWQISKQANDDILETKKIWQISNTTNGTHTRGCPYFSSIHTKKQGQSLSRERGERRDER